MKKTTRNLLLGAFLSILFFLCLIYLLYRVESANEASNIKTFGDSLWFCISTLTTVGYGDVIPVTAIGHLIGSVFLLMSLGIVVTLFGAVISVITGEALPLFLLGFKKEKNWYYFADFGSEADRLAENLVQEDPQAVIIFGEHISKHTAETTYKCTFLNTPPVEIVARKKGAGNPMKVFFMKENDIRRNIRANDLDKMPVEVYANTTNGGDSLGENYHFFHCSDCCARDYWRRHPICLDDHQIVIIGFGKYGHAMLKRAILTNILSPDKQVTYHIFGCASDFLVHHPNMNQIFSINKEDSKHDGLFFHEDGWACHREILKNADRVIICEDDEDDVWNVYWELARYYTTEGTIYIRTERKTAGIHCFGTDEQIYTPRHILLTQLNSAAIHMNDQYKLIDQENFLTWSELNDSLQQSKIAAADHLLNKVRILTGDYSLTKLDAESVGLAYKNYMESKKDPARLDYYRRIEHQRWMRYYIYNNWSYGPYYDADKREQPMVNSFENLTEEQKATKDYAWEVIQLFQEKSVG